MANGALSRNARGDALPMAVGLALVAGAGMAIAALANRRPAHRTLDEGRREALAAYLHDHLGGADVALQVVERLRRTSTSADERMLFEWLYQEFHHDRATVESLLQRLGTSPASAKRIAGHVSGALLKFWRRRPRRSGTLSDVRGPGDRRPRQTVHVACAAVPASWSCGGGANVAGTGIRSAVAVGGDRRAATRAGSPDLRYNRGRLTLRKPAPIQQPSTVVGAHATMSCRFEKWSKASVSTKQTRRLAPSCCA